MRLVIEILSWQLICHWEVCEKSRRPRRATECLRIRSKNDTQNLLESLAFASDNSVFCQSVCNKSVVVVVVVVGIKFYTQNVV